MGKKASPINENFADNLIQLEVMYDSFWGETRKMGMYIPPHVFNTGKLNNGVLYDFTTPYDILTKQELLDLNKGELLESLKSAYSRDIAVVLETITNAQRLNSPALFYRQADCIAAKHYAASNNKTTAELLADTSIYDCIVPYVEGIPPERLFEVRNQIPEAFKDFRALLFELVTKTMKNTNNPAEFKFKIDSEIASLLRKLNVEMKNAKNKWNIQGLAAPLTLLTGSLAMYSSGIDYTKLLTTALGTGGVIQSLKTWNDVRADKNKASLNPILFLWKSQKQ
jgi:hypothetical protein